MRATVILTATLLAVACTPRRAPDSRSSVPVIQNDLRKRTAELQRLIAERGTKSGLDAAKREGEARLAHRTAWIRSAVPCEPPAIADTSSWRETPERGQDRRSGILLPREFTVDGAARSRLHAARGWRSPDGIRVTQATWFWGPDDADSTSPCRLVSGQRAFVVEVQRDTGGVSIAAFEDDTTWRESDGLAASSPRSTDLPLLWTIVRVNLR